jgi:DNA polymerase sigma
VKDKSDIDLVVYMRDDGIDGTIEEQREKAIAFLKIHIASHSQCS